MVGNLTAELEKQLGGLVWWSEALGKQFDELKKLVTQNRKLVR